MNLANYIQDMSAEELLGIIKPFLYLVPLIIVIIVILSIVKLIKSLAVKRMLIFMESKGVTEDQKRAYLTDFLMRTSNKDLIKHLRNCPVCGKKYSLKKRGVNARGDIIEEWNHDGCTFCNTKVYLTKEENYKKYFAIKRTQTTSPKEKKWQEIYLKLDEYIDFYKPFIDCSPETSEKNLTINIWLD